MTEGSPVRLILSFAFPLLVGNLFQQMYNLVDAAIVGRFLGTEKLAAVGASSSVQFLVLGFCIGICCGFGIPVAQQFGAKEYGRMRRYIFNGALLTVGFGVLLTLFCVWQCSGVLHLLSTPEGIYTDAYRYLLIIFLGIPFTLLYNFLSAILRSVGDSRTPFLFLAVSTVLNIVLDLVCIIVLELGCAGAALATVAAQAISGIACLFFIWCRVSMLHPGKGERQPDGKVMRRLLWMGVPMGLQYSITAIGSMVLQSANNGLGQVYISAFTAGMRIKQFLMCPFDALATAVSTFCSQNLGAGKMDRIRSGLKQGVGTGVAYGVFSGLILIFAGRTLSLLFISRDSEAVLDAAAKYLCCMGLFFWSLGILNVCRMCTQGLGYSGRAVFSGAVEMVARIFVSLVFVPAFGFSAICFADQSAWVSACIYIVPTLLFCLKKLERPKAVS